MRMAKDDMDGAERRAAALREILRRRKALSRDDTAQPNPTKPSD